MTGEAICTLEKNPNQAIPDLAFSPDGQALATVSSGAVQFWDPANGQLRRTFDWGIGNILSIAFAPDGLTAAAGSDRGQIVIWDLDA